MNKFQPLIIKSYPCFSASLSEGEEEIRGSVVTIILLLRLREGNEVHWIVCKLLLEPSAESNIDLRP